MEASEKSVPLIDRVPVSAFQPSNVMVITLERFAEQVGVGYEVARGWVNKGYLPTYKIGKYSLINLAQFNAELLNNQII